MAPRDATVVLGLDKEVEVLRAGDFSVPVYVAVFLAVHLALLCSVTVVIELICLILAVDMVLTFVTAQSS